MSKKEDNENLTKAKKYFSKKLESKYKIDKSFEESKFRNLDDESLKISKIKARIDVLRNKNNDQKDKNFEIHESKDKLESEQSIAQLPDDTFKIIKSEKNFDDQGKYLENYKFGDKNKDYIKIFSLRSFELNSKLVHSGTIIKIPKFLLINLLKTQNVRLLNKYEIRNFKEQKKISTNETIRLSEIKRSRLNNSKKLSD